MNMAAFILILLYKTLKWSNYLKKNPRDANNEFKVENIFPSLFATVFNIKSIPRYILLSNIRNENS